MPELSWNDAIAGAARHGLSDLVKTIAEADERAAALDLALDECRTFQFLDRANFEMLKAANGAIEAEFFWRHLHQLLIVGVRMGCNAARSLFSGLGAAIVSLNPLPVALTLRSLIEHAAVLEFVRERLGPQVKRMRDDVWPAYAKRQPPQPTDIDRDIHAELYRMVFGRGTLLEFDAMPENDALPGQWTRYYEERRGDRSVIPPEERVREVGKYIAPTKSKDGCRQFRAIYNYLSEYCHANGSSRAFDFWVLDTGTGKLRVTRKGRNVPGPGLRMVVMCAKKAAPSACNVIVNALEAMVSAMMPIRGEPRLLKDTPPVGHVLAVDVHGRHIAVPSEAIDARYDPARAVEITEEQAARVARIRRAFLDVSQHSLEHWLNNFRMETVYVEDELRLWEHLAMVYTQEVADRPAIRPRERKLLYAALCAVPEANSLGDLLSSYPAFKGLPDLERVFRRVKQRP